ncbi:MAG: hypothetical protein MI757_01470 [Pirellulales bacterium]|nr:hypothetical protein [Pirellulales bacterium]
MKNGIQRRSVPLLVAFLASVSAGCSSDREQYHVSGKVTFDNDSVPAGAVFFDPDVSKGNDGTQGYSEIKGGNFDTSKTGRGVTGGAYIVRVRGYVPASGDTPPMMLFKEYRQTIELPTASSQQEIAVPKAAAGGQGVSWDPT